VGFWNVEGLLVLVMSVSTAMLRLRADGVEATRCSISQRRMCDEFFNRFVGRIDDVGSS